MNSTKNKLFAAIAMLIVAAVAMTGTSFAWFTISTAPRVDNLDVSMAATRNFEIAAVDGTSSTAPVEPKPGDATVGQTKWGATVKFSSSEAIVFPMTATKGGASNGTDVKFQSVNYDDTGRIDSYKLVSLGAMNSSGVAVYMANIATEGGTANWVTAGAVYGVYLRANHDVSINISMGGYTVKNAFGAEVYAATDGTTTASGDGSLVPAGGETAAQANARLASAVAVSLEIFTPNNDGTYPATGKVFIPGQSEAETLSANKAYKVLVTVYFDGESIYARDVLRGLKVSDFDIEFTDANNVTKGTKTGTDFTPLQQY